MLAMQDSIKQIVGYASVLSVYSKKCHVKSIPQSLYPLFPEAKQAQALTKAPTGIKNNKSSNATSEIKEAIIITMNEKTIHP